MTLLREPLLHFILIGGLLFGGYAWLNDKPVKDGTSEPVSIGEGDVRWLKQVWTSQWLREPTADELKGLLNEMIDEELLAREAQEMGLQLHDTIIRRRLAQKLEFLVEDTAQLAEPTEEQLKQFYAANITRFETPARISFSQIYFNPGQRNNAASDAMAVLAVLKKNPESDRTAGDRLLLGDNFAEINELGVSSMFGPDFSREVFALEPGEWRGPLKSGYGLHLVLIRQRTPAEPQPFASVKDAVLTEWRKEKQRALTRDYLADLRTKYGVELDDSVKAVLGSELTSNVGAK
jgi:parvulin-like peptidyl-prolyl isomerase